MKHQPSIAIKAPSTFLTRNSKIILALAFILLLLSTQSFAQGRPGPGKPPQEAIDACVDKAEGDSVSFETRRGDTMEGVCELINETLVAVPLNHEERKAKN